MVEIRSYMDRSGKNAFEQWFDSQDARKQARITTALTRVEQGNFSAANGVAAGVLELRIDFGPGYRIYCGKDGEMLVILLAGGSKKRQQADIEAAQELWQEYKVRNREVRDAVDKMLS